MFTSLSTTPLLAGGECEADVCLVADAFFQPSIAQLVRTMAELYSSPRSSRGSDMPTPLKSVVATTRAAHALGRSLSSDKPVTW
jgi:hypothetical protein